MARNQICYMAIFSASCPLSIVIDGENVEGKLKVQDAFTSYFANIDKTTVSSASPSSFLSDSRSTLS